MEYYFEGKSLSDYDRRKKISLIMDEVMSNLEDHSSLIEEALEYLLADIDNGDVLRVFDNVFDKKDRR